MKVKGETAVYHVVSSPTLEGFVPGDREKDFLLSWIVRFLLHRGPWFSIMGNHFHLLVRMQAGDTYSDEEVRERYERRYGEEKGAGLDDDQMRGLREKMSDLSAILVSGLRATGVRGPGQERKAQAFSALRLRKGKSSGLRKERG
ncbi:MAG: hypothetical protein PHS17_10810, partial [Desulfobacterales bacterium]|nr:hypothetical protein [Desulfobacterales bacterium]